MWGPPARKVIKPGHLKVHAGCPAERGGRGGPGVNADPWGDYCRGPGGTGGNHGGGRGRELSPGGLQGQVGLTQVPQGQVPKVAAKLPPDSVSPFSCPSITLMVRWSLFTVSRGGDFSCWRDSSLTARMSHRGPTPTEQAGVQGSVDRPQH